MSTEPVCVRVTMPPSSTASRVRPCEPTRYAPTSALPCPGVSACRLPRANESRNAESRKYGDSCTLRTNPVSADITADVPLAAEEDVDGAPGWLPSLVASFVRDVLKSGRLGVPLVQDERAEAGAPGGMNKSNVRRPLSWAGRPNATPPEPASENQFRL